MVTFISYFQRTVVEFAFTIFIILVRFLQKRSFAATSTEAKLKASEQQNANLRVTSFGQHTESEKYHHGRMLKLFDAIFHEDKLIKAEFSLAEDIRRERVLRIAPLFNELKSYLDKLEKNLEKEEEPELLKAVKYALTEYPCMLRCLEDGSLDLSNNICERQIRRIAKYRNNSYFVCSPESGVRFARLMSHFANIGKHNLDPVEYLSDVFRRIKTTAKDKLVDLLEHRWQPATVGVWA